MVSNGLPGGPLGVIGGSPGMVGVPLGGGVGGPDGGRVGGEVGGPVGGPVGGKVGGPLGGAVGLGPVGVVGAKSVGEMGPNGVELPPVGVAVPVLVPVGCVDGGAEASGSLTNVGSVWNDSPKIVVVSVSKPKTGSVGCPRDTAAVGAVSATPPNGAPKPLGAPMGANGSVGSSTTR